MLNKIHLQSSGVHRGGARGVVTTCLGVKKTPAKELSEEPKLMLECSLESQNTP